MKKILGSFALAVALGVMMLGSTAGAAKAPTTPATITLNQTGDIHYGDVVTFTVTYDPSIDKGQTRAEVELVCTQTAVVYDQFKEPGFAFLLNNAYSSWSGGAASCVAKLEQVYVSEGHIGQVKAVLASTPFNVLA